MAPSTRRMILPERVLGMSGTIQTLRGLAIFPISLQMASEIFLANSSLASIPRFEGDVEIRLFALDFMVDRHHGGFGHLLHHQGGGFDLLGAQTMTGDVDDVIDAAQDAE
jgi:hypothetical protein